jgi:hypothetical protein
MVEEWRSRMECSCCTLVEVVEVARACMEEACRHWKTRKEWSMGEAVGECMVGECTVEECTGEAYTEEE